MFRKFIAYILFIFSGLISLQAQESLNTLLYKGNRDFDKKNYDKASSTFMDAVKKKGDDFGAHYNLANSLYKKKMYDQANAEYQKAQKLTRNPDEKAASFYNMGNSYLQNGNVEKAIESYKNALKNNPDNEAILKNLQIAKKKQNQKQNKEQQQNQKQNNQNNDQQEKGKQQDKEGEDNQENKNQNTKSQDNGNQGVENQGKGSQGKLPNQQNNNQNQQNNNQLPKDLQQLILQRSANQERETARNLQNKKAYSVPESNEKDW
jgi:tetratricopeptide (TPR) repeat protein